MHPPTASFSRATGGSFMSQEKPSEVASPQPTGMTVEDKIEAIQTMLHQLNHDLIINENGPNDVARNWDALQKLKDCLHKLKSEHDAETLAGLKKEGLTGRLKFLVRPTVVKRLLELQKDSAVAVGALATLGGATAITLLYSATRGDLWYPFVAWFMFGASMAATTGMALATSGSTTSDTTTAMSGVLGVLFVMFSLLSCASGWATLAVGVVLISIGDELHGGGPKITSGPNFATRDGFLALRVLLFIGVACAGLIPFVCYFTRMFLGLHAIGRPHATGS